MKVEVELELCGKMERYGVNEGSKAGATDQSGRCRYFGEIVEQHKKEVKI